MAERVQAAPLWAPLRLPLYRTLWLAVLVSNIGTWMQTVGAQWVLVQGPGEADLAPLVQTATTLPVALLALPGGVLADRFDRRLLLLRVQAFQVGVAVVLAVLTGMGVLRPGLLLAMTFLLGAGTALTAPAYQSLIPELVPREQIPSASALGAISLNLARSVGPSAAGLIIAHTGATAVFALNAVSFAVFGAVLYRWKRPVEETSGAPELFGPALRAGTRYVRHSPSLRRLLMAVFLFAAPAMAIWSLLPLLAVQQLGLGADGYGLLLGALGVGAIIGALLMGAARHRLGMNGLVLTGSLVYAAATATVVLVHSLPAVLLALLPAGAGWIVVLSSTYASVQLYLPEWVRGRGLAIYQIVQFGSQAVGAAIWGWVAESAGLVRAFLAAALVLLLTAVSLVMRPLREIPELDRTPASYWPDPQLALDPDDHGGPVLVMSHYTVRPEDEAEFLEAMQAVRRSRLRTGAITWQLYRTGETPERYTEQYVVPTWTEHLRQHTGRLTGSDRAAELRAGALSHPPPVGRHLFPTAPPRARRPAPTTVGPGPVGGPGG